MKQTVLFSEIAGEIFVMVTNVCGLIITRVLFRKYRRKLKEYSGEALSYQWLEERATLGLGVAILLKSKLQTTKHKVCIITDKKGYNILIKMVAYLPNVVKKSRAY